MRPEYPDQILKDHPTGDSCPTYYDGCNCTVQTLQRAYELLNAATKIAEIVLEQIDAGGELGSTLKEAAEEYRQIGDWKQGMFSKENLAKFNIPE